MISERNFQAVDSGTVSSFTVISLNEIVVTHPNQEHVTTIRVPAHQDEFFSLEVTQNTTDKVIFPDLFSWAPEPLTGDIETERLLQTKVWEMLQDPSKIELPVHGKFTKNHWLFHYTVKLLHDETQVLNLLGGSKRSATETVNPYLSSAGLTLPQIGVGNQRNVLLNKAAPYQFVRNLAEFLPNRTQQKTSYLHVMTKELITALHAMENTYRHRLAAVGRELTPWNYRLYCSLSESTRDNPRTWEMISLGVYSPTRLNALMKHPELTDTEIQQFNNLPDETFRNVFNP